MEWYELEKEIKKCSDYLLEGTSNKKECEKQKLIKDKLEICLALNTNFTANFGWFDYNWKDDIEFNNQDKTSDEIKKEIEQIEKSHTKEELEKITKSTNEEVKQYGYIAGYKKGGDILTDYAGGTDADSLVFPIINNYRMYIELTLKNILEREDKKPCYNHDLRKLWKKVKNVYIPKYHRNDFANRVLIIDELISYFMAIDNRATAFRYMKNDDDRHNVPNTFKLNLEGLNILVNIFEDTFLFTYNECDEEYNDNFN